MVSLTFDSNQLLFLGGAALAITILFQAVLATVLLHSIRASRREQHSLAKDMYGVMRKIEGLTAQRREQVVKHYDAMLESLSTRLPPAVAAETSETVLELERRILSRLAELEPHLENDEASKQKMDSLIQSMESLERTLVALASDTVRRVMAEGRRSLLDDPNYTDLNLAA